MPCTRSGKMLFTVERNYSAADGFLQYVMERLLSSSAPEQEDEDEELDESGDSMKLPVSRVFRIS